MKIYLTIIYSQKHAECGEENDSMSNGISYAI